MSKHYLSLQLKNSTRFRFEKLMYFWHICNERKKILYTLWAKKFVINYLISDQVNSTSSKEDVSLETLSNDDTCAYIGMWNNLNIYKLDNIHNELNSMHSVDLNLIDKYFICVRLLSNCYETELTKFKAIKIYHGDDHKISEPIIIV